MIKYRNKIVLSFGPINEITLEMVSVKQSKAFIDEGEEEVRAEKLGI